MHYSTSHYNLTIYTVLASFDQNCRSYPENEHAEKSNLRAVTPLKSLDRSRETICAGPPHGLTIYQVSAQSDVNCRRSYPETKKSLKTERRTDGQTDAEVYNNTAVFQTGVLKKKKNVKNCFKCYLLLKPLSSLIQTSKE